MVEINAPGLLQGHFCVRRYAERYRATAVEAALGCAIITIGCDMFTHSRRL
jgi:hypothetical protein